MAFGPEWRQGAIAATSTIFFCLAMSASALHSFDSQHDDMLHDAQFDFYTKRLATCSSDRQIKIWNVGPDNTQTLATTLEG